MFGWFKRKRWEYVGVATSLIQWVSEDDKPTHDQTHFSWALQQRGRERRAQYSVSGAMVYRFDRDDGKGLSPAASVVRNQVHAWIAGGPLPAGCTPYNGDDRGPRKPKKPQPDPPVSEDGKRFIKEVLGQ